jgi:hypothetical protein
MGATASPPPTRDRLGTTCQQYTTAITVTGNPPAFTSNSSSLRSSGTSSLPVAAAICNASASRATPRQPASARAGVSAGIPGWSCPAAPDGRRTFEALGGYLTLKQAEAALADALARRSHGIALDPAKLTISQYLDRWLAHIRTSLRARTVARYAALLRPRPTRHRRPATQEADAA